MGSGDIKTAVIGSSIFLSVIVFEMILLFLFCRIPLYGRYTASAGLFFLGSPALCLSSSSSSSGVFGRDSAKTEMPSLDRYMSAVPLLHFPVMVAQWSNVSLGAVLNISFITALKVNC